MKVEPTKEWCEASAKLEGGSEVRAGVFPASSCSLRELIEDELRDLWQWGYDREPRDESVQHRLDAIMRIIEANSMSGQTHCDKV